ncbi:hypothetical protein [Pseudomonas nitroreducens]|uniref:hypothetical protein n=1 Tax=Pseudomonas nitroreducens TaxID=46680 RepID=UPI002D7E4D7E|nr:hypothetical protein [Pseudomonas nitroreducens]
MRDRLHERVVARLSDGTAEYRARDGRTVVNTVGSSDPFPPGNGLPYAGVIVPVHITTIIQEKIRR